MSRHTLIGASLRRHASQVMAPAIVAPEGEIGFGALLARVARCAAWLAREGCRPGEVIGVTIADELTHLVVSLGLLDLGVPQVGLSTHDPAPMRLDVARRLGIARVIVSDRRNTLPVCAMSLLPPDAFRADAHDDRCEALDVNADAAAVYFTSSGTTGEPKIVELSQRMVALRAERKAYRADERLLLLTTIEDYQAKTARLYGVHRGLTSVFQAGASSPQLSAEELCRRFGVTRLDLTVRQAADLAWADSARGRLPATVGVFVTGSRVPTGVRQALRASDGARLYVEYGARECGGIASTHEDDRDDAPDAVGAARPGVELEIVDDCGGTLPTGERGEVRVRVPGMIREYHQDPVATARHFRDGWFHPGDIGSFSARRSLHIHGRADDLMNLNTIKIFPAEIERMLEAHPAVKGAAAFALSSPVHGDIPVAAVELHDSRTADSAGLMAYAREQLGIRAPRRIAVVSALPRNSAGKIARRELADLFAAGANQGMIRP